MEAQHTPAGRMYTAGQMALATFLGSPLAGCWFLSRNYDLLGDKSASNKAILAGAGLTMTLLVLALLLPENFPNAPFYIAPVIIMRHYALANQGKAIDLHRLNNGLVASWWTVVGISLVIMLMVLFACAVVGVVYLLITEPEILRDLMR